MLVGGDGDCGPLWMAIRAAAREARYCFADRMTSENSLSNCYLGADDATRGGQPASATALVDQIRAQTAQKCLEKTGHAFNLPETVKNIIHIHVGLF